MNRTFGFINGIEYFALLVALGYWLLVGTFKFDNIIILR
jgi:hypothetical protein